MNRLSSYPSNCIITSLLLKPGRFNVIEVGVFPILSPSIMIFAPSGSESNEIVSVEPVNIVAQPFMTTERRLPDWFKVKMPSGPNHSKLKNLMLALWPRAHGQNFESS